MAERRRTRRTEKNRFGLNLNLNLNLNNLNPRRKRETRRDNAERKPETRIRSGTDAETRVKPGTDTEARLAARRKARQEARMKSRRRVETEKRRNMRNNRRRFRMETGYLFRFLSMFVIFVCVFAALTMFFRVKTVAVMGEWVYTAAEIQKASGVSDGDNLFFLNKFTVRDRLYQALPYLEEAKIRRKLPDTLIIEVQECKIPMETDQDGTAWIFNASGKIIDRRDAGSTSWARVTGCGLLSPSLGTYIVLDTDLAVKQESLIKLMTALRDMDMTKQVGGIDLKEASCLRMRYGERFSVKLPYAADYTRKLKTLEKLLQDEKIQSNMKGTFDLTRDNAQYFQPDD